MYTELKWPTDRFYYSMPFQNGDCVFPKSQTVSVTHLRAFSEVEIFIFQFLSFIGEQYNFRSVDLLYTKRTQPSRRQVNPSSLIGLVVC